MKKRLLSLFLAVWTAAALLCAPASALFDDIPDAQTASAVEVLRFMGVLDGYSDGTFRPDAQLNRAQFCKMVVNAIGREKELGSYAAMTIFPDVRASHWAAPYINLAARGEKIISGYADGNFHPERPVTLGQAAAILLRLLGYKDENIRGLWPYGHVAQADAIGLLDSVGTDGNAALTRGQAARLFVNLLSAETAAGASYYTLSEETTFTSIDAGTGKLVTPERSYEMEKRQVSSSLVGSRGQVVLKGSKALTFLPVEASAVSGSTGAVIVSGNSGNRDFSALTGRATGYSIYKNGLPAASKDLKAGDVATWAPATDAVLVCDTRIAAYYETCKPNPAAPTSVQILGTSFDVLPSAVDSVAQFKPGQTAVFLLTADGRVAGAVKEGAQGLRGNAVAVRRDGGTYLLCGGAEIKLDCALPASAGIAAYLSSDKDGTLVCRTLGRTTSGALDVQARKLGNTKLAENVRLYNADGAVALEDLEQSSVSDIAASRTNWAGNVDLIVLGGASSSTVHFGIAKLTAQKTAVKDADGNSPYDEDWRPTYRDDSQQLTVLSESGSFGPLDCTFTVQEGAFVAAVTNRAGDKLTAVSALHKLENISTASWIGKTAVTYGGRTYTVPANVPCYNRDNSRWMELDDALNYASRMNLYIYDGVVRIVEVKS